MAKIFMTTVKRITNVIVSSSVNVLGGMTHGISIGNSSSGTAAKPSVAVGTTVSPSGIVATMAGAIGTALSYKASGNANNAPVASGVSLVTTADLGKPQDIVGATLVQVTYDLTGSYGANAATTAANSGSVVWGTPTNAQGVKDGTVSTINGSVTAAVNANLDLTYPNSVNKTDLTITAARIDLYFSLGIGAVTAVSLFINYNLANGTPVTSLATYTTTQANLTTPASLSIPITTWAQVDGLVLRAQFSSALGNSTATSSIDAAVLVITATKTDTPL